MSRQVQRGTWWRRFVIGDKAAVAVAEQRAQVEETAVVAA